MDSNIISVKQIREGLVYTIDQVIAVNGISAGGRERALAITKLQEARMWLGQALAEMGNPSPYVTGNDTTTDKVDPPADMPVR